jgi:outer membrane lipoprotein-sorting protein
MTKINNLEKKIKNLWHQKNLGIETSTDLDRKILQDAVEVFEVSKKEKTDDLKTGFNRRKMQHRLVQIAASAVVVICVVLAIFLFRDSGVILAKVAEKVEQMETCQFRSWVIIMTEDKTGMRISVQANEMAQYIAKDRGMRCDIFENNTLDYTNYLLFKEKESITVWPEYKKYVRKKFDKDMTLGPGIALSPGKILKAFKDCDYKKLKPRKINGKVAIGIEVKGGPRSLFGLSEGVTRLWVDIDTHLPVRMEFEGSDLSSATAYIRWVSTDYRWNVTFDDTMFQPNIPDDYSEREDVDR